MLKKLRRRLTIIFTSFTGAVLVAVLAVSTWFGVQQLKEDRQNRFIDIVSSSLDSAYSLVEQNENITGAAFGDSAPYLMVIHQNGQPILEGESWQTKENREILFSLASTHANNSGHVYDIQDLFPASVYIHPETIGDAEGTGDTAATNGDAAGAGADAAEAPEAAEDTTGQAETESATPYVVSDGPLTTEEAADAEAQAAEEETVEAVFSMKNYIESSYLFTITDKNLGTYRALYCPATIYRGLEKLEGQTGIPEGTAVYRQNIDYYEFVLLENLDDQHQQVFMLVLGYVALGLIGLAALTLACWLLARLVVKPTAEGIQRQADFVAAASHELRSPLAVVRSSLSAAQAAKEEAEALRYRKAAEAETERMSRLVDDLLLLAGGDAGKWQLQSGLVDLDTVLIETSEHYTPLAKDKGLRLSLNLPDATLPSVRGDSDRLRQILGVLLDNAMQYAPKDSEVTITARTKRGKVEIDVADHGRGIPENDRTRVFERFYRADSARNDKSHFGLGLSVAQELAALHGGSLSAHETQGGGATLRLTLPAKSKPGTKPAP